MALLSLPGRHRKQRARRRRGAPPNMLVRHAVLLTPAPADVCLPLACPEQRRATPLESTLVEVFILNSLNLFRINTFYDLPRFAQFWCNATPFRIQHFQKCVKTNDFISLRMNTYEKTGEGGRSPQTVNNP